jgi:hypothetical protein
MLGLVFLAGDYAHRWVISARYGLRARAQLLDGELVS